MTKREAQEYNYMMDRIRALGISQEDAEALRRISMTLRRWFELECGTGEGQVSISIERDGDEPDSRPYKRIQYPVAGGYVDRKYPVADRETGARKRLTKIMERYPTLIAYVQGDPRGCSLYILTAEQIHCSANCGCVNNAEVENAPCEHDLKMIDSIYTRGIAIG